MGKATEFKPVDIELLKPYKNNAKIHSQEQIEKLSRSIKEFGFLNPILIDKDFNIIAGHGRVEAAKVSGLKDVPCVFVEGLTEAQRKAYILADNRLSEFGKWDEELVNFELEELTDLDFDISDYEFDEVLSAEELSNPRDWYGDERERTNNAYNLGVAHDTEMTDDFWQMPVIRNDGFIPDSLIGFNYAKTSKEKKTGIHFFIDDYQFERVWANPEKYVDILKEYDCILSPDFSLYMDMPIPMKIWNIYRSRQIGSYYQSQGIKVIPTISWAEKETFTFCFAGIPEGSIVAISTIGVKTDEKALQIWKDGVDAMIEHIEPSTILIYGGYLEHDFKNIPVKYFENGVLKRWTRGNKND